MRSPCWPRGECDTPAACMCGLPRAHLEDALDIGRHNLVDAVLQSGHAAVAELRPHLKHAKLNLVCERSFCLSRGEFSI
jgi:hypothetical protein